MGGRRRITYQMIHQILSNTRQVYESRDTIFLQFQLGTNTGAVQDVGTAIRTTTDDDFLSSLKLNDGAVRPHGPDAGCPQLTFVVCFKNDFVHMCLNKEVDVGSLVGFRNKISARASYALIDSPGSMAAPVRVIAMGKHVMV